MLLRNAVCVGWVCEQEDGLTKRAAMTGAVKTGVFLGGNCLAICDCIVRCVYQVVAYIVKGVDMYCVMFLNDSLYLVGDLF